MKKYIKPTVREITISSSELLAGSLPVRNEEGNGIQRSKYGRRNLYEEDFEEEIIETDKWTN